MATIRRMRTTPPPAGAVVTKPTNDASTPIAQPAPGSKARALFRGGVTTRLDSKAAARAAIHESLQLIARNHEEIDKLSVSSDIAFEAIEGLMRTHGLTVEEAAGYKAEFAERFTRGSRSVVPALFREKVSQKDYEACVEIPLTKAAQYLGEKELNDVCEHKAPRSDGFKLKIDKIKVTVQRTKG